MDKSLAVERMSETENLTDGLDDDDANWLLEWGTSHVGDLIAGIADDDAAGEKVNQLMAVMRSLNGIAADHDAKSPADLASDITKLSGQYAAAFGGAATRSDADVTRLAQALPSLAPRDVMQRLLDFLAPEQPPSSSAAPQLSQESQPAQPAQPATTTTQAPLAEGQPKEPAPPTQPEATSQPAATQSPQDHTEPAASSASEPEPRTPSEH
jgi:hypothetical protein